MRLLLTQHLVFKELNYFHSTAKVPPTKKHNGSDQIRIRLYPYEELDFLIITIETKEGGWLA
jgi:hypothetical protein